jgi:hypothetical protein
MRKLVPNPGRCGNNDEVLVLPPSKSFVHPLRAKKEQIFWLVLWWTLKSNQEKRADGRDDEENNEEGNNHEGSNDRGTD